MMIAGFIYIYMPILILTVGSCMTFHETKLECTWSLNGWFSCIGEALMNVDHPTSSEVILVGHTIGDDAVGIISHWIINIRSQLIIVIYIINPKVIIAVTPKEILLTNPTESRECIELLKIIVDLACCFLFSQKISPDWLALLSFTVCLPTGYPVASMTGTIENGELRRPVDDPHSYWCRVLQPYRVES